MISLDELFETVVILVRETPESSEHPTSTAEKVQLYGLYKHVREGPCDGNDVPSVFYAVARTKYQAWQACESLTEQEAMMEYVQLVASKDHWKTKELLEEYRRETKDSNMTTSISPLRSVFDKVASFVRDERTTPGLELSSAAALQLEGLYKHLTVGTCVSDVPTTLDATEKAQHQAWWACQQKSKEQAMLEYIQSVASHQDHWVGRKAQELLQDYRQHSKSSEEGNVEVSLENEQQKNALATIIKTNDDVHDTPIIQASTASEENESKPTRLPGIKPKVVSKSVVSSTAKERIAAEPKPSLFTDYATYLFGLFGVRPLIPRGQIDISYSDLFFALMQCCRYWRSSMRRYQTLYQQIQDLWSFDSSGVAVGLSARSLLDLYLCVKKYPAGSEVIMIPPISVPGICHVLKYHDLSIIPVDCTLGINLEAIQEALTDKTVAIMVVHAFGKIYASPEEFQQLRQLADAHNVELWEDGAECFAGLGESCYRGSLCADLRFFSFGMIKTATAIGGGVVLLRDKALAKQMQGLQHSFYKQQSASEYLSRIVMGLIVKAFGASPLLYGLLAAICSFLGLNFDSFVTASLRGFVVQAPSSNRAKDKRDDARRIQSHMVQQIRKRPSPALLAVLHRRLKHSRQRTPGIDARLNRCQRMTTILQQHAPDMIVQYTQASTEHTYWLFPIRCHNRESVSHQMLKAGFDVAQGASQLCCVSRFTDERMCPQSEKFMSELLYLPVSSRNLSEATMTKLARALQSASTVARKGNSAGSRNARSLKTTKMLHLPVLIGAIVPLAFLHSLKAGSFLQPLIGLITMILGTSICVLWMFAIGLHVLRWLIASFYLESSCFAKYSNIVQESECGYRSIDAENKTTSTTDTHPHVLSLSMGASNVPETQVTNKSVIQFMKALKFPETSVLGQATTNKVILTGATGFIGSLLLRDILMHREALSIGGGVIVLCRKKRNESAKARIQKLLADPMFAFLSDEEKRKLVHVVQGDVTHPEAGLSSGDIKLVCEDPSISHVFHCAASVSFTQDLPGAAKANITSSLNIQSLTGKLKNDDVQYVQISTAFIHGGLSGTAVLPLQEKLHSLSPYDPVEIYKSMLGTQFYASKAMNDLGFPNTYTFSKCVCEHLLLQESPVSTMIVRPSIVGPAIESPFEGWAGEKPSTLVAAACLYMSYQWNLWCFGSHSVPYIPVDILSRFILAKAFSDKVEEGKSDSSANESLSTDSFERISGASDISSDSGDELLTTSLKIKNFRHGRIFNAVWDTKSAQKALFSWHDYAVAICQLGSILGYFDRATAYIGLIVSTRLMPSLQLSTESYELVHSVLVLGPIRIILKLCRFVGYAPKHLSKLSVFLDLPLLFFPFTNKSFHFRSELIAPDTVDGERYLFSCVVAAHQFLVAAQSRTRPANGKESANSTVEASQDMTKLIVGGGAHDAPCSDLWWALSQPRGSYLIRLAGFFFRKILRAAASVVTVDATSFAPAIAALCSKENSKVYLILAPTHRSFFDFILLGYLFFELPELCIDIPFVAAAEEFERLPLVGWMARSLRAFYIKRGRGNADPQLTATLEDLKQKQLSSFGSCLEVFLEGTRSRDRRFVHPRTGFLKCLKQSGGGHLVVPITICYEGIPEQDVLAEEAAGTNRRRLNLGGMFLWLKRVAEGKVSLGRIHVAASNPLHMNCETADDFKSFADHVQRKQQEMMFVSNYHLQATSKLLKIDPSATKDGMTRLGCKFWPEVESIHSGCSYRLELPDDPSDLCTIMLQYSHNLAPLFYSTRPKWSAWLNRVDPVGADLVWTGEASTQLIADSIAALFDDADDCAKQAFSLLNTNGFSSPKLEHLLQTAKRLSKKQTPLPLLRAAASRVLNENRNQDALQRSLHDASKKLILSGQPNLNLADSDEVLGSWGFQDSGFLIQASKKGQHFVTMKGNRYGVCGKPLTKLLPFIETEMQVRVNPLHEAFAHSEIWLETTPSKFEATVIAKLRSIMSRVSFSTLDRARHGTGHSQEDIFLLRSGTTVRIPDAVMWPSSEQEVETLVALAKVNGWCLIPFGGGTNVSNATRCPSEEIEARPIISVDMKEMSRILWLNEEDGLAHVQAGITGRELVEEMARRGFTIGHEPDSIEFSTLGGWIATKASGMKRSKYGNIEDIVKSVRVVGSKGMLWKGNGSDEVVPGRVAEGLDLCSLMLGSEGCLGVITSAVIRVWPLPEAKEHESVVLPCFEHGLLFMRDVAKLGHNIPASVRLLDNEHFRLGQALSPESSFLRSQLHNAILKVASYWNGPLDHKSVVCATICYEGSHDEVQAQKRSMKRLASTYGGVMLGSRVGKAGYDLTFMIAYLRDFAMTYHFLGESFETFCPWSKIETLIEATKKRIVEEHGSRHLPGVPFVGCRVTQLYHEGACLYFYFCMNFEGVQNASEVFAEIEREARQEILKQGGSLSHHHGIGKIRAPLMKGRASSAFDQAMASVKKGMDQDNIFGARNGLYSSCSD